MVASVPLAAVLVADLAAVVARHQAGHPARPATTHTVRAQDVVRDTAKVRAVAIRALLATRSHAILTHDRAAFLATIDPRQPAFRAAQARWFDNLAHVPLATWRYDVDTDTPRPPYAKLDRYHAETYAPLTMTLHYQLAGFDRRPTNLDQHPTFVRRGIGWYLGSLSDFADAGSPSSVDLWDFGPVTVMRGRYTLVLGHPGSEPLMRMLVAESDAAVPRVTAVWGRDWPQRVVVLVPSSQTELAKVVHDTGNLDQIAAVATAEVNTGPGRPDAVGDRVAVNPPNFRKLAAVGRRVVLTHEITHVATREASGEGVPTWLVEGFADYVGYAGTGVPVRAAAHELQTEVQAGKLPVHLPTDAEFDGSNPRLPQVYEEAWLACRLVASRWGEAKLVRLYRALGGWDGAPGDPLAVLMPKVLGTTPRAFTVAWRAAVRGQLG